MSDGLSTEQFPVSAYVGSSKNTKDLKVPLQMVSAPPSARERESEPERDCARECPGLTHPGLREDRPRGDPSRCARAPVEGGRGADLHGYRGKSKISTRTALGPYSRAMPRSTGTP